MGNYYVFFIFLIFLQFSTSQAEQLTEIDFYAFFVPNKNLIICSEKEDVKNNLLLNEYENDNGYTCLINLKKNGVYRINLHVLKVEDKHEVFKTESSEILDKDNSNKVIEIAVGKTVLYKNLNTSSFTKNNSFKRQFLVKFEKGKVSYIPNNDCNTNEIETCNFIYAEESVFMKKFIKLSFTFTKVNFQEIILLEKASTSINLFKITEDCDPACVYGVCNDGDCLCKMGYMGINCSIEMKETDFRIGMAVLVIFIAAALAIGILLTLLFYYCYLIMFDTKELKDTSKEVDIMEHWGKGNNSA